MDILGRHNRVTTQFSLFITKKGFIRTPSERTSQRSPDIRLRDNGRTRLMLANLLTLTLTQRPFSPLAKYQLTPTVGSLRFFQDLLHLVVVDKVSIFATLKNVNIFSNVFLI